MINLTNIEYVMKYKNPKNLSKMEYKATYCPRIVDRKLKELNIPDCLSNGSCEKCWNLEIDVKILHQDNIL